jgi:cyanate permease
VWLGGYLYDHTGSYQVVWYLAIGLGVAAGLLNLPIREVPVARLRTAQAAA